MTAQQAHFMTLITKRTVGKNISDMPSPLGDISAATLIRTDTTLDHSQKAEKVRGYLGAGQ